METKEKFSLPYTLSTRGDCEATENTTAKQQKGT